MNEQRGMTARGFQIVGRYIRMHPLPFVVAVNCFEGAHPYAPDEVRAALDLDPEVPVVLCDARLRESAKGVLVALVEHVMRMAVSRSVAGSRA